MRIDHLRLDGVRNLAPTERTPAALVLTGVGGLGGIAEQVPALPAARAA